MAGDVFGRYRFDTPLTLSGQQLPSRRPVRTPRPSPIDSMESTSLGVGDLPWMGALKSVSHSTTKATFNTGCPMPDSVRQRSIKIQVDLAHPDILGQIRAAVEPPNGPLLETPIRFAVTKSDGGYWTCELGTLTGEAQGHGIFHFNPRSHEDADAFNVVMLVPTGIGARSRWPRGRRNPRRHPLVKRL